MAHIYPELKKLTSVLEIRSATKLGLRFPVGPDNRHRVNFWPFGTVTSRCSPSSSTYMLAGGSPAFRHLAKPANGEILIEADWSAQEIWIAAYLVRRQGHAEDAAAGRPLYRVRRDVPA